MKRKTREMISRVIVILLVIAMLAGILISFI
jgi:hypothetical protein